MNVTAPTVRTSPLLLDRHRSTLIVVDVQHAFARAVPGFDALVSRATILVRAARILDVPVIVTEQYPRGLGDTVAPLLEHLDGVERLAKTVFSAARADGFALAAERDQVVVCGVEAHVCVNQTVCDLAAAGRQVHVVADAVASRTAADREAGLEKMWRSGALRSSVEMAAFEWLQAAGGDDFKAIQELVK